MATAAAGDMVAGLVGVEDEDGGGGGGGGGTVESKDISLLFVDAPLGGDDVSDGCSSLDVGGDEDDPVPLIEGADVLSDDAATAGIPSEFVLGEGICSTTGAGGGSSS